MAALLSVLTLLSASLALAAKYVYDDNGRLVVTVNEQSGESARYVYDKVGNLLRIERLAAGQIAIFSFTPARGGAGVAVKIEGQGFSPTASNNIVKFNGTQATVTSAEATALQVTVPVGATTGPLTVTVGTQTATGPADFVVDESAQAPVITGMSPLLGPAGTQVTVTGRYLYPGADHTRVYLGPRVALPSTTSTNQQVVFTVPLRAGSGKVTVATPYGSATTAQEFMVVPAGVPVNGLLNQGALVLDGPARNLSISAAGQAAGVLLDSGVGAYTSLQFSNLGAGTLTYTLYGPDNRVFSSGNVNASAPSVHLPRLSGGTYLLLLKPGSAPANWTLQWEKNKVINVDGEAISTSTGIAYQTRRVIFSATSGLDLGLGVSDLQSPEATANSRVYAKIYRPDGGQLTYESCWLSAAGCDVNVPGLGASGTYAVLLEPAGDVRTMSYKLTLSRDKVQSLTLGTPLALSLPRPGQNARLHFQATAGQTLVLSVQNAVTVPASRNVMYTVYRPDGSLLQSASAQAWRTLNLVSLPATGAYALYVDPEGGETLTAQVDVSVGLAGNLQPGDPPGTLRTQIPGQNAYFSFDAVQGANLGLGIADLTTPSTEDYARVIVNRPDGTQLAYENCYTSNNGCDLNLRNLAAGKYSVVVVPPSTGNRTMSFKPLLSADVVAPLTMNVPVSLALNRRGQNGRLTFTAQAGDTIALNVAEQTTQPTGRSVYYALYSPEGVVLQGNSTKDVLTLNVPNLPVSGEYFFYADPGHGETLAAQVKLVPGQVGGGDPGGELGTFETQTPGQNVYFSFNASEGANLGLGIADLVTPGANGSVWVAIKDAAGNQVPGASARGWCDAVNQGCGFNLEKLKAGTYNVEVQAPTTGDRTMRFKAVLNQDKVMSLEPDTPMLVALERRGQNGRLTFNAVAGQRFALSISGQTTFPANRSVSYKVNKPDGTLLKEGGTSGAVAVNLPQLPVSGRYEIFVDPNIGATSSAQVTLLSNDAVELQPGGEAMAFSSQVIGQEIYISFVAEQGANLGLGIFDLTSSASQSPALALYGPDGGVVARRSCDVASGGCDMDLQNLAAGRYLVIVEPPYNGVIRFMAVLSEDKLGNLSADEPYGMSLNRRGQNGRLTFFAEAGQTLALNVAGQTTVPQGRYVDYIVKAPDGAELGKASTQTGATINLRKLPVRGQYTILINPSLGATTSARVTLVSSRVAPLLVPDGSPESFITYFPDQYVYFEFEAKQGENLGLGIADLVASGVYQNLDIVVKGPSAPAVTYSCSRDAGGCDLDFKNLAAGRYEVTVKPPSTGTMSFLVMLSHEVTGALQLNTPMNLTLGRRGQDGRLTFSAEAGQTLVLNISAQTTAPAGKSVSYTVLKPDGTNFVSGTAQAQTTINLKSMPVSGQYTVFVDPNDAATMAAQLTLKSGQAATLVADGEQVSLATEFPGQYAYLSFSAAQGDNFGLGFIDAIAPGANQEFGVMVTDPTGRQHYVGCSRPWPNAVGCSVNLENLVAGNYVLEVQTPSGVTMSFQALLSRDVAGALPLDTTTNLSLNRRGQNGRLTFTGQAGQTLALKVTQQTTVPANRTVYYRVRKPDGTQLTYDWTSTGAMTLSLGPLPVSGQYTVFVDPNLGETATMKLELDTMP